MIDGSATYDALPTTLSTWKNHSLTFFVSEEKAVTFRIGQYKSVDVGGGDSPVLYFDNLKLYNNPADKTELQALVDSANVMNNNPEQIPAGSTAYTDLSSTITAAQVVLDNASASAVEIAIEEQNIENAIADVYTMIAIQDRADTWSAGEDITNLISEPSFNGGINGWDNPNGFWTQGNDSYAGKEGALYIEKWQSSVSWTNQVLSQTIQNLPNGIYKVTAGAFCSGESDAFVFANDSTVEVRSNNTSDSTYTVMVTISNNEIVLGYKIGSAGTAGNYIGCDNFNLTYIGPENTPILYLSEASLSFDAITTSSDVEVNAFSLNENITITAPAAFTTNPTSITPIDGGVETNVSIIFNNTQSSSGYIYFTSGDAKDSLYVEGAADPTLVVNQTLLTFDDENASATFTVNGANLTEDITITAPSGFSLDATTLGQEAGETTITTTYDALAESRGYITITSSGLTKKVRVIGFMNFTPLYATGNLISDPSFNSLDAFGGWKNREITTDTLAVYSGRSSFFGNGNGICWDGDGFSLDYSLELGLEANSYYRLRAMVKTLDGALAFGIDGADINGTGGATVAFNVDTEGEWAQYDQVFLTGASPATDKQAVYFNSCEGTPTGTKGYLDNYELYKMPIHLAADSIFLVGVSDSVVAVTAQLANNETAYSISAPTGITISAASVAADGALDLTVSFNNSADAEGYVVFDNGTYSDSIYVKATKNTVTSVANNIMSKDKVFVSNGAINVSIDMVQAQAVSFKVYSLQGTLLASQVDNYSAGKHSTILKAELPSGVYLVNINKGGMAQTYKIVK